MNNPEVRGLVNSCGKASTCYGGDDGNVAEDGERMIVDSEIKGT